jgi:hypothetical protein
VWINLSANRKINLFWFIDIYVFDRSINMNWKTILALTVLVTPVAYCSLKMEEARYESQVAKAHACAQSGGFWTDSWGGYCER